MNLVSLADLAAADVHAIWRLAAAPDEPLAGTVGWSFASICDNGAPR